MKKKDDSLKKAKSLQQKGDEAFAKEKWQAAIKHYKKAIELAPENKELYEKIIKSKELTSHDWKKEDLVDIVSWTMEQQELLEPEIKQVHAKFSENWEEAASLATKLLICSQSEESEIIEKLVSLGEIGTRAAVDVLCAFKKDKEQNDG
ncbi:MAG: tetratricopeptide repeat protein [Pseudomonadota bacterium]